MTHENIQVNRHIHARLPKKEQRILALLTGARQTGKTTSLRALYPSLPYYNLDSLEIRDELTRISSQGWARDVNAAVLDEIQKLPILLEKVKYAYDSGQLSFSAMSGSAQIMLLKSIRETLAGRILIYELWPLMLSELLSPVGLKLKTPLLYTLLHNPLDKTLSNTPSVLIGDAKRRIKEAENYLLTWGGMPALLQLKDEEKLTWLKSYELTYVERDLADLARLNDLNPFRTFKHMAALRSAQLFSYSDVARDAAISVDTVKRYLEFLRLSFQAITLQPYLENLTSRLIKTPKVYWADIGLWRSLTGIYESVTGPCFETFVVLETIKYIRTAGLDVRPYFYRTRSGMEVDLLLEKGRNILAFEIKARERIVASDARQLRTLAQALGERWLGGIVAYRGEKIEQIEPGIWAVPSWRLFS